MLAQRIQRARQAAGLSLRELGARVGVSQTAIRNYEQGTSAPSSAMLIKLGRALGVRTEYFFRAEQVVLTDADYRKHAAVNGKVLQRVHADVVEQLERHLALSEVLPGWLPSFAVPPKLPEASTLDEVEAVADSLRAAWRLGENPIPDLMDTLEAHGIVVLLTRAHGDSRFDGLAARWGGEGEAALPVVVVGADWPGDRQRFTLAHELGHLMLKGRLAERLDEEKACHRFAGAFLAPTSAVRSALGEKRTWLEPRELALLKGAYGLSMSGWLRRAYDLGIVNKTRFGQLNGLFRKRGWHLQEPAAPYPRERPQRFARSVCHALAEDLIGESRAAELLGMPLMQLHAQRW
jgi:Zn-dependent peptidase ImmA (M78 family)/DNA-binding XRE family transcriptional regulator